MDKITDDLAAALRRLLELHRDGRLIARTWGQAGEALAAYDAAKAAQEPSLGELVRAEIKRTAPAKSHREILAEIVTNNRVAFSEYLDVSHQMVSVEAALAAMARVAAPAPDLLAACEDAVSWLEGWASAEPYISRLRAAIAKATGAA